ncbi:MAG: RNase adapter RapZ [Bacteroidales bacterium]
MNKKIEIIKKEFAFYSDEKIIKISQIKNSGSDRHYFRVFTENNSFIGVYSNNLKENETFIYFTKVFSDLNFNVPKILYISKSKNVYFLNDLGDTSLLDVVLKTRKNKEDDANYISIYTKVVKDLAYMQFHAYHNIDFDKAYKIKDFNKDAIVFDLNYFKYYFLNRCNIDYNEVYLNRDFNKLASSLEKENLKLFMFRDFQARNILIYRNQAYYIDYQGGRRGSPLYDLASLLFQAKAELQKNIKTQLAETYLTELSKYCDFNLDTITDSFYKFVFVRVLQTLGAYGLRGIIENKQHFKDSIPYAIKQLKDLLNEKSFLLKKYPELLKVLNKISELTIFDSYIPEEFTVTITSFSYKLSYPTDETGNGGGFVFDCRFLNNPGRYPEYKTLTGKDPEVIKFLKENSNADEYVLKAYEIVKPAIMNYIERGFRSLQINFGCTGGQHRSVYCAELMNQLLKQQNIKTKIIHREINY